MIVGFPIGIPKRTMWQADDEGETETGIEANPENIWGTSGAKTQAQGGGGCRKPHGRRLVKDHIRDGNWALSLAIPIGSVVCKVLVVACCLISAGPLAPTPIVWAALVVVKLCLDIDGGARDWRRDPLCRTGTGSWARGRGR